MWQQQDHMIMKFIFQTLNQPKNQICHSYNTQQLAIHAIFLHAQHYTSSNVLAYTTISKSHYITTFMNVNGLQYIHTQILPPSQSVGYNEEEDIWSSVSQP